jgi:multiple sugar transport system substrate-binding protein
MHSLPRRAAPALAIALSLALAGCPSSSEYTDPDALVIATYSEFTDQTVGLMSGWRVRHPETKVALVPLQPADFQQAMYPRLLTGAHVPDVLLVDAGYLARFGPGPLLADLSTVPGFDPALLGDLPPAAVAQGRAGGRLVGVPADLAPLVLFARMDLLDRAGVTEAELTSSWAGFVAACAKVKAATGAHCLSWEAELFDWVLRTGLPSNASPYVSAAGVPYPDRERIIRAFELARGAAAAGIASRAAPATDGWRDLLRQGRVAVQAGGPAMLHRLERSETRASGTWRALPLPERAALATPSVFCVLAEKGGRKALAWELVRGTCLDRQAQVEAWEQAGAFPALRAAAADPRVDAPTPFLGGQVVGPAWRAASASLPVIGFHRVDPIAADILMREVDRVVRQGKPAAEALADARAELAGRMDRQKR